MDIQVALCYCFPVSVYGTYLLFTHPTNFSEDLTINTVHVTKAQIHAWLEQIQKFKDLILFLKTLQFTFENGLNYTTKQIDKKIAFNE